MTCPDNLLVASRKGTLAAEEQERDASERAELTHIGDTCIGPADRRLER